jgi:hypothetical protein
MRPTFLIADTHFWDFDMCSLKKDDGHPLRPFSSVENCPSPITFGELRAEMRKRVQSSPDHHNDA